mgnify:FL=1
MIFVAASPDGPARARVVSDDKRATLEPVLLEWIDPETTSLITDDSKSYRGLGKTMADHQYVIHSQKEYANPDTGAHVNTAEAVISRVQRALVGAAVMSLLPTAPRPGQTPQRIFRGASLWPTLHHRKIFVG